MDLPSGVVTFLMTDIEGSTRLWQEAPEAMRAAVARHDAIAASTIGGHGGSLLKSRGEGDSTFSVFARATDAVTAASQLQQALTAEPWPEGAGLRVRIAVHTGEADLGVDDYYGIAVNRCARLRSIAHGGQVLVSEPAAGLVREALPEDLALRDLGFQRLRDLAEPERVSQLLHPSLPSDFPGLRTIDSIPNNLPYQVSTFVGREAEMTKIRELLRGTRLLTLTGAGGVGKTRLALQAAAEMLYEFPDGVWLADLASLSDSALVPQAVATALGVREEPGVPLSQTLAFWVRAKHLLLLLDNCEHLVDASAEIADGLLRQCPELRILATSRETLRAEGETVWRVPSLSVPHPQAGVRAQPGQLTRYAAVRLFIDRASKASPGFTVTDQNAPAVAGICSRLDGIPLAVELAAARTTTLTPEQIERRLDERFGLLRGGRRTALPRQQTLEATVKWSFELLSEREQQLFARLSVFAGGFTLEAAESVCSGRSLDSSDVAHLLGELASKSLAIPGTGRYWMLQSLLEYGRRCLESGGEADALRREHARYFTELAESAARGLEERWATEWLDQLETERDNWRAALRWCFHDEARAEGGLRLAAALGPFFMFRGAGSEGQQLLQSLLSRTHLPTPARVEALCVLGRMTRDMQAAGRLFEQSLALARELGHKRDIARVLYYGAREHARGRRAAAAVAFEESLAISREIGHTRGIARALGGLAFAHSPEDLPRTRLMLEESLSLYRELGDCQAIGETLNHLGWVADRLGDREEARTLREESLACAREAGDMRSMHFAAWRLGFSALDRGDVDAARQYGDQDVAASRQLGDHAILVDALLNASHFAQRAGDLPAARAYSEEAVGIARETGADAAVGSGLYHVACATPDLARRRALLEEACAANAQGGAAPSFSTVALADAARLGGGRGYAATKLHLALTTAEERSHHFLAVCAIMSCGDLAEERGDARRAVRLWTAAERLAEGFGWAYCRIDRRGPDELAGCRAALGESQFAAAVAEGGRLTLEEAIACALEGLGVPPSGSDSMT